MAEQVAEKLASPMDAALAGERVALTGQGGVTDGAVTYGVKPSTPRNPADVRPERVRSRDLEAFPMPSGREEEWRFTPLNRLRPLFDAVVGEVGLDTSVPGTFDGVEFGPLYDDDPLLDQTPLPVDRLSASAERARRGASLLRIAKGTELDEPVLVHRTAGDPTAVLFDHLVIEVGEHARATVVLEHTGSARVVGKVSVLLADDASLDLVSVQAWDDDALQSMHVATRVGRDARLRSTQVSLGGSVVRIAETVDFAGPGGDVQLQGLAFADAGQHLEHRLFIDHATSHCKSRVTYKTAVQGEGAHTVWIGDVLIRAEAEGTNTYELNRNLLLTDSARADSVPNLEIETGEIAGAGHASATGRFDDEQLFYLQSRGITTDEARRIVVLGFFTEILHQIGVPSLQERLVQAIEQELRKGAPAEAEL